MTFRNKNISLCKTKPAGVRFMVQCLMLETRRQCWSRDPIEWFLLLWRNVHGEQIWCAAQSSNQNTFRTILGSVMSENVINVMWKTSINHSHGHTRAFLTRFHICHICCSPFSFPACQKLMVGQCPLTSRPDAAVFPCWRGNTHSCNEPALSASGLSQTVVGFPSTCSYPNFQKLRKKNAINLKKGRKFAFIDTSTNR